MLHSADRLCSFSGRRPQCSCWKTLQTLFDAAGSSRYMRTEQMRPLVESLRSALCEQELWSPRCGLDLLWAVCSGHVTRPRKLPMDWHMQVVDLRYKLPTTWLPDSVNPCKEDGLQATTCDAAGSGIGGLQARQQLHLEVSCAGIQTSAVGGSRLFHLIEIL
eukprot:TRINITY_DN38903_c0_g2_i1.p1 TRINITY_DN38903_c0_g2~~TRINITY_DN38903_c0_g2_i1.p1  ORF type:complete len:162 (+),score=23.01 TRINITY_DN38903_c0_g2_i1:409-894(+)